MDPKKEPLSPVGIKKNALEFLVSWRLAIPMILAGVVGSLTGLIIVAFIKGIGISEKFFFDQLPAFLHRGHHLVILIPVLGALVVGVIVTFFAPETRGHGVPEVMKALVLGRCRIPARVMFFKPLASAISIGSGSSVGREGPAVQIGASMGSFIGRIFKLSEIRVRNLVACGTAAGISAVFNAPITGVMFALEIILRDFGTRALSTVVLASVASSVVTQIFLGESPAFIIPAFRLWSPWEIFTYLGLGILSALIAVSFTYIFDRSESLFEKLKLPLWIKPAAGGLIVGCIGYFFPQVFGMGFKVIDEIFTASLDIKLLLALVFLKIIATSVSLGSGSSGGTFGPTLFVGAALGGIYGKLVFNHMPFPVGLPGAYALVGMASVFSGAFHAPVTAIFLVFELTRDYRMILPIMIASVVATSISQLLNRESMDTMKFRRTGVNIGHIEEVKLLGALQAKDAMSSKYVLIPEAMPAKDLIRFIAKEKNKVVFVTNSKGKPVGYIQKEELQSSLLEGNVDLILATDLAVPLPEYCFKDDPLNEATRIMLQHNLSCVPVMDSSAVSRIIGVLRSEDIFRTYTELSAKRTNLMHDHERLTSTTGTMTLDFSISPRSLIAGKAVREVHLPHGVILTVIKRKKDSIIPHGDTILNPGDKVIVTLGVENLTVFESWLAKQSL